MKKVSIVGLGRFGKTLFRLLKDDFDIVIFDRKGGNFTEVYQSEAIFYCVPISAFEKVIKEHKKYFTNQLLIDVLSVKMHPAKVFERYLKNTCAQALLTHPMFGPDSSKDDFGGLTIVMDKFMTDDKNYLFWKNYFLNKGLKVVEMTAQKHDRLAANYQGVTHFIGRLLNQFGFESTSIDTLGAKKLHEVQEQTCNDTWELFMDLQNYNPYTESMRIKLGKAYDRLYNRLLPNRVNKKYLIYGIQGGIGSFNEEAIMFYIKNKNIKKFKIKYLYTTEKVLKNLIEGNTDYGLFAIHNAVGGVVQESTHALAKYKVRIVDEFPIIVRHFLMKRKDINVKDITTIMAHPQVFKQCKDTLNKKFIQYKLLSGKGDLVDTAKAAWALAKNKLPKNYVILGPKHLSDIYDLEIIAEDLQDNKKNYTSFFLVSR